MKNNLYLIKCESAIDFAIEYLLTKYEEMEKIFLVDGVIYGKCIRNAILGLPTDRIDVVISECNIGIIHQLFSTTEYSQRLENGKFIFECERKPSYYIQTNEIVTDNEKDFMIPMENPGVDIDSILYSRHLGPVIFGTYIEDTLSSILRKIISGRCQLLDGISPDDYLELIDYNFDIFI
jgi:hypothetical protein